jgi:Tfp pilus assembly protein PilF
LLEAVRAHAPLRRLPLALSALLCLVACQGIDPIPKQHPPSEADRRLFVRGRLQDALAYRSQGRLEAAEASLRRGLEVDPDDARTLRLLARVLDEEGRPAAAREERARADAVDPPPPLPPDEPLVAADPGLVVLLVPPPADADASPAVAREWPDRAVPELLASRLRVRVPGAAVTEWSPESVADARHWLEARQARAVISLRVERASCGDSTKDGPFALVLLRYAAAAPGGASAAPQDARELSLDPDPDPRECLRLPVSRALEQVLRAPGVAQALRAPGSGEAWSAGALRAVFPTLGKRIARELARGRIRLDQGRLSEAADSFRRAAAIDPEDREAREYLLEAQTSLAMSREIAQRRRDGAAADPEEASGEVLAGAIGPEQRQSLEEQLAEERERRHELLAALEVVGSVPQPPGPEVQRALRPWPDADPASPGARLATALAGGPVEARALFAPDGTVLARFWVAGPQGRVVLREDDTDGDGRADRWSAATADGGSEIWEDRRDGAAPDVHRVLGPDGRPQRIELLAADGRITRVFRYQDGHLASDAQDVQGRGRLDRIDHFAPDGSLVLREEDLDDDGRIDVRSTFSGGKLVRREILDAALVQAPETSGAH